MSQNFTKYAFTDSVRNAQARYGSESSYDRMNRAGDRYKLTEREIPFIRTRDSFYMATVGENGWPYVQFRGGPPGFLKVLDETTLGYLDFQGNMQYISMGNLSANRRASLFLMDYPTRRRLKIWAETTVMELDDDADLLAKLDLQDYPARPERIVLFDIKAYDWNCRQHITPRFTLEEIEAGMAGIELPADCQTDDESK